MGINKELSQLEFIQRESGMVRLPYEQEMEFYSAVASGDIKRVKELYTPRAQPEIPHRHRRRTYSTFLHRQRYAN